MSNNRIYLDIHAIQTLPPSNINRDDTGSPKTCTYGGVRRARVSSQAWKKAMRDYFMENSGKDSVGIRSLRVVDYLADKIQDLNPDLNREEAVTLANDTLEKAKLKPKFDDKTGEYKIPALFFIGERQARDLARAALDGEEDKKKLQQILKDNPSIDIALFGRMLADDPSLNEDASSQVAHAISTHAVQTEFDFYTAVDDLNPDDTQGAGMLGTMEFNSSTLYRYANVAVHEFYRQLAYDKDQTINALKLYIEAFSNSLPTGKINSFANQTLPQALVVSLREDRPVNLVSAFETPVKASEGSGMVDPSIERLFSEYGEVEKFVKKPLLTLTLTKDLENLKEIGQIEENLKSLLEDFGQKLSPYLEEREA